MPKNYTYLWFWIFCAYIVQGLAYVIAKLFFSIFLRIRVHGIQALDGVKTGVIFASNHVHELDSVLLRTCFPLISKFGPLFAVARPGTVYKWKGWRRVLYWDYFFRLMGAHSAPKGLHNYEASLQTFVEIGKRNESIVIFIGGRQHAIDEPIENRGGASYLVWATKAPIVPVAIRGTFGLTTKAFFFKKPQIDIYFGAPIPCEKLFSGQDQSNLDFKEASKVVTIEIEKMLR